MMRALICDSMCAALLAAAVSAQALEPALPATGSVQYGFAPQDRVDRMIIDAIDGARRQVLVQAFSFTHRGIARALIDAHRRGVEVAVIADREQTGTIRNSVVPDLARAGVPVSLDGEHAAAHNKIIVIDAGAADCAVITGSFNFTFAAQYDNAENAVVLRGNPPLCDAYRDNWQRHRAHAVPYGGR
ncbi:MAG TPA: phospholipase D family protein [Burkholderiales bacterium]|nr:phospholipase D family protein [Burkholderiales bacterium]